MDFSVLGEIGTPQLQRNPGNGENLENSRFSEVENGRKRFAVRQILLRMTPSHITKAFQAPRYDGLLDRADTWEREARGSGWIRSPVQSLSVLIGPTGSVHSTNRIQGTDLIRSLDQSLPVP